MKEESINYKVSINDCFKINEYLVNGTPCSFKKMFNIGYGSVDVLVEIIRGNVILKIKDSKVLDKK